jgi:NAD(P)-dependent dehydrogenase (short-subunit alcohol dehydrogenase family)
MRIDGSAALVTGGASGLGTAAARHLIARGADVTILDLPTSQGAQVAAMLGGNCRFVPVDVTDGESIADALDEAVQTRDLRVLVHCAGRGGSLRILDKAGAPGDLDVFRSVVDTNLVGSFNMLRLAAERMAKSPVVDGERGVCVLTASVAAFEGQIGQIGYAASKSGVAGMTIVAARDLAARAIRVCTIAPGLFDTPMLARLSQEVRDGLAATIPHPRRLGDPDEFGMLAAHIVENPMLNGEVLRLDGALRMGPR